LSGTYEVKRTSALPVHISHSTIAAPSTISPNEAHDSFGATFRALSSAVLVKWSTAISKNRMKKISMFMPCTPRIR
jgi:hypothetical protein